MHQQHTKSCFQKVSNSLLQRTDHAPDTELAINCVTPINCPTTNTSSTAVDSAGSVGPCGKARGPPSKLKTFFLCSVTQRSIPSAECVASRSQRNLPVLCFFPEMRDAKARIHLLIWRRYLSTPLITGPLKAFWKCQVPESPPSYQVAPLAVLLNQHGITNVLDPCDITQNVWTILISSYYIITGDGRVHNVLEQNSKCML